MSHKLVSRMEILCVVSQGLQVVLSQQSSDVHKNARFKHQPSTPNAYLCINEKHIFMEIDDKGGEIVQRYESFEIEIVQGGEIRYESLSNG